MRVLSLFDGISCGRIALDRAGIPVTEYYASEIEKTAIKISASNWPDIKQVGSVTELKSDDLGEIDLLIGGSPCQGFSMAGKKLNFDDPRSKLFFEFVRLKEELSPKFWLLENVKMKKSSKDVISEAMGCEPVEIDSALFSAQRRKRLYWTNIPIRDFVDNGVSAMSIIDHSDQSENTDSYHRWFSENYEFQTSKVYSTVVNDKDKAQTLTRRYPGSWNGNVYRNDNGSFRFLSVKECERLQTVPEGYCNSVSKSKAYEALGNGWTVDVIAHIFRGMKEDGK